MKRQIFLTTLLVAALALGGCGGGGGGDDAPITGTSGGGSTGGGSTGGTSVVSGGALGPLSDLGDLEGATGPNWLYTDALAISNSGKVVGESLTVPAAFIWDNTTGAMDWLGIHLDFSTGDDLYYDDFYGTTGKKPFIYSSAVDINDSGWAIGNSNTGTKDADGTFTENRAFLSDGTTFIDIAPITRDRITGAYDVVKFYSKAVAINNNGYVILTVEDGDNSEKHGYSWDGVSLAPATAPDGSSFPLLRKLSWINGEQSEAIALNETNGAVVNSGNQPVFTQIDTGFSQRIGTYGSDAEAKATDINNSAQIVGTSGKLGFFWEAGSMTRINSLGGDSCSPVDINNPGQVVGSATTASGATHAFLWKLSAGNPVMTDLGTLGGTNSYATAISDAGHIVGYSDTGKVLTDATGTYAIQHAFYWADGKMYDLGIHNDFYNFPFMDSYPFSKAVGINENGTVVGNSTTINGSSRGFVLTPPSPLP